MWPFSLMGRKKPDTATQRGGLWESAAVHPGVRCKSSPEGTDGASCGPIGVCTCVAGEGHFSQLWSL